MMAAYLLGFLFGLVFVWAVLGGPEGVIATTCRVAPMLVAPGAC